MKKAVSYISVIIITSVLSIIIHSILTGDDGASSGNKIQTSLYSKILGEERELIIHLPRDYDSAESYPVMYVLDGGSQATHIANTMDVLATAGYTPKTIIVGIPNTSLKNREKNLTPPFMRRDNDDINSELGEGDKFLRFMESELFAFIEGTYSTTHTRLFSGNSRGGLLVMYSLVYRPEMFHARFCYSTPFWRQDNILATTVGEFLDSRDTLSTFIYMSAGENETDNIKNGLREMTKTIQAKAPIGLTLYSDYTPNAIHQDNAPLSAAKGIARWSEYMKQR